MIQRAVVDTLSRFNHKGNKITVTCYNTTQRVKAEGKEYATFVKSFLSPLLSKLIDSLPSGEIDKINREVTVALSGKRKAISRHSRNVRMKDTKISNDALIPIVDDISLLEISNEAMDSNSTVCELAQVFACDSCDNTFETSKDLQVHIQSIHGTQVEKEQEKKHEDPIPQDVLMEPSSIPESSDRSFCLSGDRPEPKTGGKSSSRIPDLTGSPECPKEGVEGACNDEETQVHKSNLHDPVPSLKCERCPFVAKSPVFLEHHYSYWCEICTLCCVNKTDFETHMYLHKVCVGKQCEYKSSGNQDLNEHVKKVHPIDFKCEKCDEVFDEKKDLYSHMKYHPITIMSFETRNCCAIIKHFAKLLSIDGT